MDVPPADALRRCHWVGNDPLYIAYHDREWGFPVADDRRLLEKICLEGFQAGLRWRTILGNARRSVKHFSDSISSEWRAPARDDVEGLLRNPGNRPAPRQDRIDDQQRKARPR